MFEVAALGLVLVGSVFMWAKQSPNPLVPDDGQPAAESGRDAAPAIPARCSNAQPLRTVGGSGAAIVEVGSAAVVGGHALVGAVTGSNGRAGAVVSVDLLTAEERRIDLPVLHGEAPAPRVAAKEGHAIAVALLSQRGANETSAASSTRSLAVFGVTASGVTARASVPEVADDSAAYDVTATTTGFVLAWDESRPGATTTQVRCVRLDDDGALQGPCTDTTTAAEVESIRVVPRKPDGAYLVWIASRPSETPDGGTGGAGADRAHSEGPGELPRRTWVEWAEISGAGQRLTGPERLALDGQVASFDVTGGDVGPLLALTRSRGKAAEMVTVPLRSAGSPVSFGEVSPASEPALFENAGGLFFLHPDDTLRFVPLPPLGANPPSPSSEPELGRGRVLALTRSVLPTPPWTALVAVPAGNALALTLFGCAP